MSQRISVFAVPVAALMGFALAGAVRAADTETGSVEGKVTLNGKPLAKGKVVFHPKEGKPVEAEIKDGQYKAKDVPAGATTVVVEGEGVPKPFQDAKTTPLQLEVKKGKQTHDFELKN
jgi:hypothetical protein